MTFGHCEVACFNTTITTSTKLLLHDLVSSATPLRENQRQNLSPRAAQHSSSRPRSPRAGNQRTAVPAPPVLGTRERPCPFHPCRDQRAGQPSVTDPAWHPPRRARSAFCDGPELHHRCSEFIYKITIFGCKP